MLFKKKQINEEYIFERHYVPDVKDRIEKYSGNFRCDLICSLRYQDKCEDIWCGGMKCGFVLYENAKSTQKDRNYVYYAS